MKILVLHNTFLPDYTGSSLRLYNLLCRIPYNILVLTPEKMVNGEHFSLKEEYINSIHVKRAEALSPKSFWKLPLMRHYYHENTIFDKAKNEEFDIIQSRCLPPYVTSAYKLSKKFNKPLILEAHPPDANINRFYMYYLMEIVKVLRSASHIISLTDSLKNWVIEKYKISEDKITVIKNGVDSKKFKPPSPNLKKSLKQELDNPKQIVMYAGYLDEINGCDMVLKVLPSLLEDNPMTSFIFLGHGPYYREIENFSKKYQQIKLIPTVKHDIMPLYYQMSDIFIIPRPSNLSSELVTPLKLLEAMSMESIVLGSDVGGIKEVIKNEKNGYLYEKDNRKSFVDTLTIALEKNNKKIGKNARKTILKEYDWDKSSKRLINIYDSLSK
jgi:glycosyltransferase involved in cell wall biosynthesis